MSLSRQLRQEFIPKGYQDLIVDFMMDNKRCAIWAGMGLGKGLERGTPVLTPQGWVRIGDLSIGDKIFGKNGKPTQVTGVFPQGTKDIFRVSFDDDSSVITDGSHLWAVSTPKNRDKYQVLSTNQLLERGLHDKAGNRKWSIPLVEPVKYRKKTLAIEPYLLGVLLGDGCITTDEEIIANCEGRTAKHYSRGVACLNFRDCWWLRLRLQGKALKDGLRVVNLYGKRSWEKFIPEVYLRGSIEQRLAILQGLLDTDGYATPEGGVEFSSTAEKLADGVVELANSLGGIARKSVGGSTRHQNGIGRESWRVNIKLPARFEPFRLTRKLKAWARPTRYPPLRALHSVEPVGSAETICISVAAEDQLYVTRNHIVTHNTVSTLTMIERQLMFGMDKPVLVLAPLLVAKTTWVDEARKWQHLSGIRVVPIVGDELARRRALNVKAEIYTTNYEQLPWLVEYLGDNWPFEMVIADESTKLKSFRLRQGGARAQALAKIAHTKIKSFIELTGTPSPNGLIDLWGQIWMLDQGHRLGRSFTSFTDRWFKSSRFGEGAPTVRPHSESEIQYKLRDICLTVDPKDWFDLEEPIVTNKYIELPKQARKLYDEMEKAFFIELGEHRIEAQNAAIKSGKLLQICGGAAYVDPLVNTDDDPGSVLFKEIHSAKIEALESIINESAGTPVLVATNFRSDQQRLLKAFPKGKLLTSANGSVLMPKWNRGEIPIMFTHPASAGHGVSLQDGGNILVFFSLGWNLEHRLQVMERIGPVRQLQAGHNRSVFIYNIMAKDTIDELVLARVETKRNVQDILLEAMARRNK